MKPVKFIMLSAALLTLLAGCIPSQQELAMSRDLEEMKRRLAATERQLAAQQTERTGTTRQRLDELTQKQAATRADLDNLRLELQSFNGRFADLEQRRNELQEELSLVRDDLGMRLNALEEGTSTPSPRPGSAQKPGPQAEQPETLYLQGVDLIRKQHQFAEGRKQMENFLQKYPQNNLAANAAYWVGESYVGEKDYEKAILQFEDVIQTYGDHPKVAAAYLKQALTFDMIGDRQSARTIMEKLVKSFPLSDETRIAKERLQTWGQ